MSKVRIELNSAGVKELLKSDEITEACKVVAEEVERNCGSGYVVEDRHYPERNGFVVYPESSDAKKDNMNNNTLLKAARI